jgi:hypothetical protein
MELVYDRAKPLYLSSAGRFRRAENALDVTLPLFGLFYDAESKIYVIGLIV